MTSAKQPPVEVRIHNRLRGTTVEVASLLTHTKTQIQGLASRSFPPSNIISTMQVDDRYHRGKKKKNDLGTQIRSATFMGISSTVVL